MIRAALDTSTTEACFTLYNGDLEIVSFSQECRRGASKLLPLITNLIKDQGISISDVDQWYVGKGPGSFTGLRVGISYVKGVCFGSGKSYCGVNSGFSYLYAAGEATEATVLHDGRKSEVICNKFVRVEQLWQESDVEVMRIEDLRPDLFNGPLITLMPEESFDENIKSSIEFITSVKASGFLHSVSSFPQTEQDMENSCDPIYVRPPVFVKPAIKK